MNDQTEENETNYNVQVVVRVRPPDPKDDLTDTFAFADGNVISIKDPLSRGRSEHTFMFHNIFQPQDKQEHLFQSVTKPLVDRVLCGYNACCFAYGQTGSGKTYSIFGQGNGEVRGLLPRSVEYLFDKIEQKTSYKEIALVVSFVEVYLDQVRDLGRVYQSRSNGNAPEAPRDTQQQRAIRTGPGRIRPLSAQTRRAEPAVIYSRRPWSASCASDRRPQSAQSRGSDRTEDGNTQEDLEIREAPNGQVYVQNLTMIPVRNIAEVMEVVNQGLAMRETHETKMNPTSSRSHTVFTINLVQKDRKNEFIGDPQTVCAQFNLVDLAGSERLAKSKSEGKRFHEAVVINASLSALGRVVLALASNTKYVPYRDSKLTRILQGGLGGNSFTTLLCCINPSSEHYEESLNSLSFADRCKNVENRPMVNYVDPLHNSDKYKIRMLMREIAELKHQLEACAMMKSLSPDSAREEEESLRQLSGRSPRKDAEAAEATRKAKEMESMLLLKRAEAAEAQKKAQESLRLFQQTQQEFHDKDAKRRLEMRLLRDERDHTIDGAKRAKTTHELLMSETEQRYEDLLRLSKTNARSLLDERERLLLGIPEVLKDRGNIVQLNQKRYEERLEEIQREHQRQTDTLKATNDEQVENIEKQYSYWLKEKDVELKKFQQDIKEFTEAKNTEIREYRTEMTDMYELVQTLSRIISDMESGVYPASYKCGIRCVTLPIHSRPKVLRNDDFPRLFSTLADTKKKAEKYERLMNRNVPTPDVPDSPQDAMKTQLDDYDPNRFAMEFCRSTEVEDDGILENLTVERLRMLACSLKQRCRGNFAIEEEKQKIREEVMRELSGHSTVEYLRHLEQEVDRYKSVMQEEVERNNNLKVALSAKREY